MKSKDEIDKNDKPIPLSSIAQFNSVDEFIKKFGVTPADATCGICEYFLSPNMCMLNGTTNPYTYEENKICKDFDK